MASIFTLQVRPDNGLYVLLLPLLYLLSLKVITRKRIFIYFISIVLSLGFLLLVYSSLFGSPLPIPFYAKSGDFFVGYAGSRNWNAVSYFIRFLKDILPFITVLILFTRKKIIVTLFSIFIPVMVTFLYYSTTHQIMGWFARYYFPSIPFFVLAAFIALEDWLNLEYSFTKRGILQRMLILVVILLPLYLTPLRQKIESDWLKHSSAVELYTPETIYLTSNRVQLPSISWWTSIKYVSAIASNLAPGFKIAATEYGYIASENLHCEIIDMAGLHNKELVSSGFSANLILSTEPDFIWMPHSDYTYFRKCLLDDTVFQAQYQYYPEVFNYGIALRLNSSCFSEMLNVTDSIFTLAYPEMKLSDYLASGQ